MNNSVEAYINTQASPQKEICQALRHIILKTFPGVKEEMKWGVPAFADGKFYIVALKDHVNVGFSSHGLTKEELTLFDGGGKTTRNLEIATLDGIDKEKIVKLLKLVNGKLLKRIPAHFSTVTLT
jgi:hypothetical protein